MYNSQKVYNEIFYMNDYRDLTKLIEKLDSLAKAAENLGSTTIKYSLDYDDLDGDTTFIIEGYRHKTDLEFRSQWVDNQKSLEERKLIEKVKIEDALKLLKENGYSVQNTGVNTCKLCQKTIHWTGKYWEHSQDPKPRHPAQPTLTGDIGKEI